MWRERGLQTHSDYLSSIQDCHREWIYHLVMDVELVAEYWSCSCRGNYPAGRMSGWQPAQLPSWHALFPGLARTALFINKAHSSPRSGHVGTRT